MAIWVSWFAHSLEEINHGQLINWLFIGLIARGGAHHSWKLETDTRNLPQKAQDGHVGCSSATPSKTLSHHQSSRKGPKKRKVKFYVLSDLLQGKVKYDVAVVSSDSL